MASTSFKKVLSEPFVTRMIIGHDTVWHATSSEARSLFVLAVCIVDRQWEMVVAGVRSDEIVCLYIVTQD